MSANRSFVCLPLLIGQSDLKGEGGGENPRLTVNIWQHIPIPLLLKILKPKEKIKEEEGKKEFTFFSISRFLTFKAETFQQIQLRSTFFARLSIC